MKFVTKYIYAKNFVIGFEAQRRVHLNIKLNTQNFINPKSCENGVKTKVLWAYFCSQVFLQQANGQKIILLHYTIFITNA